MSSLSTTPRDEARVPSWVKFLIDADRAASYVYLGLQVIRNEVLLGWVDPAWYGAITQREYCRLRQYLPGGATHAQGLFEWERLALQSAVVPRSGRVLVGAAGGGREAHALAKMGYEVLAFEPNEVLARGATETARTLPQVTVVRACYADLVAAVRRREGPLAAELNGGRFDLVVLGWGSLTHLVDETERVQLLRAVRDLAPGAPVLASFYMKQAYDGPIQGKSERLRALVRVLATHLGAPHRPSRGVGFQNNGGFVYTFTANEIDKLASACGYRVELLSELGFPHAVLVPQDLNRE